mmetsp:Transcript_131539/g.420810  ORF Transcript_131539/g.420810 Transcript_131539/m.420810 type:complete len:201 (-) Transcript_131539:132-734(-)
MSHGRLEDDLSAHLRVQASEHQRMLLHDLEGRGSVILSRRAAPHQRERALAQGTFGAADGEAPLQAGRQPRRPSGQAPARVGTCGSGLPLAVPRIGALDDGPFVGRSCRRGPGALFGRGRRNFRNQGLACKKHEILVPRRNRTEHLERALHAQPACDAAGLRRLRSGRLHSGRLLADFRRGLGDALNSGSLSTDFARALV